jgi:hypothetical protein
MYLYPLRIQHAYYRTMVLLHCFRTLLMFCQQINIIHKGQKMLCPIKLQSLVVLLDMTLVS